MKVVKRIVLAITNLLVIVHLKETYCKIHTHEESEGFKRHQLFSITNSIVPSCLPEIPDTTELITSITKSKSIYKFCSREDFIVQLKFSLTQIIGIPSCEDESNQPDIRLSRFRFRDLTQEKLLKVSASSFPPYAFKITIKKFDGIHFRILKSAAKQFNFTFSISVPEQKSTGVQLPNGTWSGMMGDILYRNYDIALVLTPTPSRYGLVDFTCPAGVAHLVFYSSVPEVDVNQWALLAPYTRPVWLLMTVTFVVMVRAFFEMSRVFNLHKIGLEESYLLITSLSLEHSIATPRVLRLLTTLWMGYTLTISTGYKSNLASYISTPETLEEKPKTFADLHDAKDYKVFLDLVGISGYEYLNKSSHSAIVSLKRRSVLTSDSSVCILNALNSKKSVCVGWDISLSLAIAKNISSLYGKHEPVMYRSVDSLHYTYGSLAMPKNSNFTEFLDFITTSSFETGLISKWHKEIIQYFETIGKQWASTSESEQVIIVSNRHPSKILTIKHFQLLFCVTLFGLASGLAQLFYEILTFD